MYLTPTKNHWACDIEGDDLRENAKKVWCACLENILTGEKLSFTDAKSFLAWLKENPDATFVGHNFISYDAPVLNRIWGSRIGVRRIVDTFVLSQLYSPNLKRPPGVPSKKGAHSLEAWGIRVRFPKTECDDFSSFTPGVLKYCQNDTALTAIVYRKLSTRMRQVGFSERGCELEHLAWHIIQNKQRQVGFPFKRKEAEELLAHLNQREEELRNEVLKLWPPRLEVVRHYRKAYRADGEPSSNFTKHLGSYPKLEILDDGSYQAYDWVTFNLGSPPQRVEKLLELGWKPTKYTKSGNPQVDEDSLIAAAETTDKPELKSLAKWLVVEARRKMLNNWLDNYNDKTGALHGKLFIASTLRYRHSDPNSANIPAVRLYGKGHEQEGQVVLGEDGAWAYECRDLYYCGDPDRYSLVGIDGTGIQNRCLIHNLIKTVGPEAVEPFKQLSLEGDIHKHNIEVLGLPHKASAKKFYYTLMMGGGGARLAADQIQFGVSLSPAEGDELKQKIVDSIPGFGELIDVLKKQWDKTGRIELCDGTPILVPSPHMLIPYLLQGDESRLMKQALIYADADLRREKIEAWKVADIHDEWQWKVENDDVKSFIDLVLPCFNRAGDSFGYLIPIDGDAKVGKTWAETH